MFQKKEELTMFDDVKKGEKLNKNQKIKQILEKLNKNQKIKQILEKLNKNLRN